ILDTFGSPAADLQQQVGLLTGWLIDAANGKANDSLPEGLRPELVQEIGAMKLRAQVAREILINLQNIEQALDRYARGQTAVKDLQPLGPQLRQIHGALSVLRWERAAGVLERYQELVSSIAPGSSEIDWL